MEQRTVRGNERQALWQQMAAVLLPLFALLLSAGFVFACTLYLKVRPFVTIELGEPSPEAEAFLRGEGKEIVYLSAPAARYKETGVYRLTVRSGGLTRLVALRVRDTAAPTAEPVETTVSVKESPTPDRLVRKLKDQSVCKLTYQEKPAYGTVGDYEAIIKIEDHSGNVTKLTVPVHVRVTRETVTMEAGAPVPDVGTFLIDDLEATLLDPITEQMMITPGTYPIRIRTADVEAQSTLIVQDTVAPTAAAKTLVVKPDAAVTAYDLLGDIKDATAVTATFDAAPDPASREPQTVQIRLKDLGGNETVLTSTLLFSNVTPFALEASADASHAVSALAAQTGGEVQFLESFVPNEIGMHVLPVLLDGEENLAVIEVCDTVAPKLTVTRNNWYQNVPKEATFFVTVADATETTAAFETEPDWTQETQQATVVATDAAGNTSRTTFTLQLIIDTEPPVLYGVRDRFFYINDTVAYLMDVRAEDDCDGEVEVQVDASAVDVSKAGVYTLVYSATDRAGNTASRKVQITVVPERVDEDEAEAVAQKILSKILTDDMTLAQQIEAIYNYVFRNVHYVSRSNKADWRGEAVRGLTTGKGDCFTSYASARLLLEHTDAQIMSVERLSASTRHYWMIVNIGTGWYHFDACNAGSGKKRCFMWTNEQTAAVSKRFWNYDKSLYPPIATERFNGGK